MGIGADSQLGAGINPDDSGIVTGAQGGIIEGRQEKTANQVAGQFAAAAMP